MKRIVLIFVVILILYITACSETIEVFQPNDDIIDIDNDIALDRTDDTGNGIKVLGEKLGDYSASVDGDGGNILVPLLPIAEKLNIETSWDEQEQKATIGNDITIWVGREYYTKVNSDAPITFGPAPELIDGLLYVPRTFFQYAIGGYETFVADGYVMIERIEE